MLLLLLACTTGPEPSTVDSVVDSVVDSGEPPQRCGDPQLRDLDTQASVTVTNTELSELNLGIGVASCDLDGDGHQDLLVSGSHGPQRRGRVGVFYGPSTDWPSQVDLQDADALIAGSQDYSYLGYSLDCGDLDGDGYGDLVVGSAELFTETSVDVDKDYVLHIWYGSATRLGRAETEASASASLNYDYAQPPFDLLYAMDVMIQDMDEDGSDELLLAANDVAADSEAGDRVLRMSRDRLVSGALTDQVEGTLYGETGQRLGLSTAALGGDTPPAVLVATADPAAPYLLFTDLWTMADGSRLTEDEHTQFVNDEGTSWNGSAAVLAGPEGPLLAAPNYNFNNLTSSLRVIKDLDTGSVLGSKGHTVASVDGVFSNAQTVQDYNGDGVDDLKIHHWDQSDGDRVYVLDGQGLGDLSAPLEDLLLDSFWSSSNSLSVGSTFFHTADLDGDGCGDLIFGQVSYGPADWGADQGLVSVLFSGT